MYDLLRFGFSGRTTWIWPLGLITDGSDGATLLSVLLLKTFLGETSVFNDIVWSVARSKPSSYFLVPSWKFRFSAIQFIIFPAKFWLRIPMGDEISIYLFCLSLGSWLRLLTACCWGWWKFCSSMAFRDTLLGTVGQCRLGWLRDGSVGAIEVGILLLRLLLRAGLKRPETMMKSPETVVVWRVTGDIGLVVLSGRRTHPVGGEGTTIMMARRAPFPLSSIPAYIEQSIKLFVCIIS